MFIQIILFCVSFFCLENQLQARTITDIYVDPAFIIDMNDGRMANKIGPINIAKFLIKHFRPPSEVDLYAPLEGAYAESTTRTFKDGKPIPLILSDWLAQSGDLEKLEAGANKYLDEQSKTKPGTYYGNMVRNAMKAILDPVTCIELHDPVKKNIELFRTLAQQGYRIHLAGNFAYPDELKRKFAQYLNFFTEMHLSGEMGCIKPSQEFLDEVNPDPSCSLFIEVEQKHCMAGVNSIVLSKPKKTKKLKAELAKNGITV